ncbi:PTS sugar transporter subunit IIA [Klebsiella pneumoniae]|uniref:PTS sugar transporter subunit IIA n=1 Tax=Klebsiella pneumoniae TaxID=573 RepID=A0A927E2M3_KLEPN|nr:PTS sugar transporter subunit IIA [Klebsiella pneumoniae]
MKIGVDLLVAADVVEPRYYRGNPRRRRAARPLFCDRSGISHAARAAGRGRQKTGFALVTLKKPLIFNHEDNDPVDILITMAAVDATTHRGSGHHADR